MDAIVNGLTTIGGWFLAIGLAVTIPVVGFVILRVITNGARKIQKLDEADAPAGELTKSGGRSGYAIVLILAALALFQLLVIPQGSNPVLAVLKFLINSALVAMGFPPIP